MIDRLSERVIGKYVRHAQNKLRNRSPVGGKHDRAEDGSPVLEKFLLDEGIHPDDVCTLLMDMIILGVQAVTIRIYKLEQFIADVEHLARFQTANCEAFLLYYLAKNPRTQRNVYDEIMNILPDKKSSLTPNKLNSMRYLKACIQESLRYLSRTEIDNRRYC